MSNKIEKCPKCNSVFIQFDNITEECYCLVRDCEYRWKTGNLVFENMYLRTSQITHE